MPRGSVLEETVTVFPSITKSNVDLKRVSSSLYGIFISAVPTVTAMAADERISSEAFSCWQSCTNNFICLANVSQLMPKTFPHAGHFDVHGSFAFALYGIVTK